MRDRVHLFITLTMIMIDTFIDDQVYFLIGWHDSVDVNSARTSQ